MRPARRSTKHKPNNEPKTQDHENPVSPHRTRARPARGLRDRPSTRQPASRTATRRPAAARPSARRPPRRPSPEPRRQTPRRTRTRWKAHSATDGRRPRQKRRRTDLGGRTRPRITGAPQTRQKPRRQADPRRNDAAANARRASANAATRRAARWRATPGR